MALETNKSIIVNIKPWTCFILLIDARRAVIILKIEYTGDLQIRALPTCIYIFCNHTYTAIPPRPKNL